MSAVDPGPPIEPVNFYAPPTEAAEPASAQTDRDVLGWILLSLPFLGGLFALRFPRLGAYATLFLLASIGVIGVDARKRGMADRYVLGAIFFWAIVYPIYAYRRSKHGAPARLVIALCAVAFYLFGLVGAPYVFASSANRASVICGPAGERLGDGVKCTAKHTSGSSKLNVCWDVTTSCASGVKARAERRCLDVEPKREAETFIPFASLGNLHGCVGKATIGADALTVNLAE